MPYSSQSGVHTLLPIIFLLSALSLNLQVSGKVQANNNAMSWQENSQTKTLLYAGGVLAVGIGVGYLIGWKMAQWKERCNRKHKLDAEKIVDTVDMEDVGEKAVFCRCWKSSKFPYCDGSHVQHNKETGDNVGPLIIKGKPILGKED